MITRNPEEDQASGSGKLADGRTVANTCLVTRPRVLGEYTTAYSAGARDGVSDERRQVNFL